MQVTFFKPTIFKLTMRAIMAVAVLIAVGVAMPLPAMASPVGNGIFKGATGHSTTGSVTVRKQGDVYVIELGGDFVLDGAPDPYVALGSGSALAKGGLVAVLKSNTGKQRYTVKATGALKNAKQVLIWCKKYAVPIGVAPIN